MTDTPPPPARDAVPVPPAASPVRAWIADRKLLCASAVTALAMVYVAAAAWSSHNAASLDRPYYDNDLTTHIVLKADDRRSLSEICRSFDIPPERYCRTSGPCRATSTVDPDSGTRTVAIVLQSGGAPCP